MSGKRNVEDIILSSRNDKLLESIKSTQLRGQNASTSMAPSVQYLGRANRSNSTSSIISPSTNVLDTLVQKIAEFEHTLNTFKASLSESTAATKKVTGVETMLHNHAREMKFQLESLEMRINDNLQSLANREEYLKGIEARLADSCSKANSLSKNEALRDEILLSHDKTLTSLITKINDLCLWSIRIHGAQEELQRRLAQIDASLSSYQLLEQKMCQVNHRVDKLETTVMSVCKDFAFYKEEVQRALKDIHAALGRSHI